MKVKRYLVDSMPDALQKIRTDLGQDAVILNTKEVRTGGFLGLFGKRKIEVIAAIEGQQADSRSKKSKPLGVSNTPNEAPISSDNNEVVLSAQREMEARSAARTQVAAAVQTQVAVDEVAKNSSLDAQVLMEEMKQMKEMMRKLTAVSRESVLPEHVSAMEKHLLEQEIHPSIVDETILQVMEQAGADIDQWTADQVKLSVKLSLLDKIRSDQPKGISTTAKIVHFVGPTGVGKTTTIAKLAAAQMLKRNRKVGLITSDTYRIAAIEQLRTYANILNVPVEVVFSTQDLNRAFERLADRDVILMDTAGRNYRNEMYVSELNSLLTTTGETETILVLSLASKYKDMKTIIENFSKYKLDKVLFTKIDETETYGSVLNIKEDFQLSYSYVTNGQNVPDDIVEFNEEQIIDLVVGGVDK